MRVAVTAGMVMLKYRHHVVGLVAVSRQIKPRNLNALNSIMKARCLSRPMALILILVCPVLAWAQPTPAQAGAWASARSENFLVVGHVDEARVRGIALQLERARAVFAQLLTKDYFNETTPTVVVVFRSEDEYGQFRPLLDGRLAEGIAGHFQSHADIHYITLAADARRDVELDSIVVHEYVHSLAGNRFGRAPLWFREGIAEYYSAFEMAGSRTVRVGKRLPRRIDYLRARALLPLHELVEANYASPAYGDHTRRGVFYAQSWALVHYLLNNAGHGAQEQLTQLLESLAKGRSFDDALRQSFKIDASTLERGLSGYIRLNLYREQTRLLDVPPQWNTSVVSASLTGAEAQGYLGDMLLRADQLDAAGSYLEAAAALDPKLAAVQTSLGILRLRENRLPEAREHLQRALDTDPQSHLAHYYFAQLLRNESPATASPVAEYVVRTRQIRDSLKRAIALAPNFLNAYGLLVLVDIERSPQLHEAAEVLQQATALSPQRQELKLLLAQLQLRREEFGGARQTLAQLLNSSQPDILLRAEARTLLDTLAAREQASARRKVEGDETLPTPVSAAQPCDMPEPGPQFKPRRFAGEQVCGRLVSIECLDTGVVLHVEAGDRTLRLRNDALNRIRFITYTTEVRGNIGCELRPATSPVLVTYRPHAAAGGKVDGEVIAVEFVPQDWQH